MEEKQINGELLRLAIITLLIASIFGILQYFPEGKTFDTISIGVVLKVIASTILYATFPIFAILFISFVWILVKFPSFPMPVIVTTLWTFVIVSAILIYFSIRNDLKRKK